MQRHTHLAYGGVRVTGGRMPVALALNTAAHSGGGGCSGRWSRCLSTRTKAVKPCRALLITQGDAQRRLRQRETDNYKH